MNFLIAWLIVGGMLGWVVNTIVKTNSQYGAVLNVAAGIAGALIGGVLMALIVGKPALVQSAFNVGAMLASLVGAFILLAIKNFNRR